MTLRTPADLMEEACIVMLGEPRKPETEHDWKLVLHFCAANIDTPVVEAGTKLMATLYEAPLTSEQLAEIAEFQLNARQADER